MVSLKVGETVLHEIADIKLTGTVDAIVSDTEDSVEIMTPRQLSMSAWTSKYTSLKKTAMSKGGSLQDDNAGSGLLYNFDSGYRGAVLIQNGKRILTSLHGVSGSEVSGELDLLPSKTLDVSAASDSSGIIVSRSPNTPNIAKLYYDIRKLIWRLYHSLNSISGRLQIYAPKMPVDGSVPFNGDPDNPTKRISTMGRYLGTFQQYQAIVARWNHYAWSNTFYLDVVEANERVAITIGYTNLECHRDRVDYSLDVQILPADTEQEVTYKSELLTIYNQGSDSTLVSDNATVTTTFTRNGKEVNGTGYEGGAPEAMISLGLTTNIGTNKANGASHAMYAEQYYRNLVAIAPCIGIDKGYTVQAGTPTIFRRLAIVGTWIVDGVKYTKTKYCNIAGVGVASDETTEVSQ